MNKIEELELKLSGLESDKISLETGRLENICRTEGIYSARLQELETAHQDKIKELEFNIIETKNRILAECMAEESKKTAAEKWVDNNVPIVALAFHDPFLFITAHESGQKHGADVERDRYLPLIDELPHIIGLLAQNCCPIAANFLSNFIKDIHQQHQEPESGNISEKPSLAEEKTIEVTLMSIRYSSANTYRSTVFKVEGSGWYIHKPGTKFKLTPIKD